MGLAHIVTSWYLRALIGRGNIVWAVAIAITFTLAAAVLLRVADVAIRHWYVLTVPMVLASFHYGLRGSLTMSVLSLALLIGLFQYAGQSYIQVFYMLQDLIGAASSPMEVQRLAFELADLRASDPTVAFQQAIFGLTSLIVTTFLLGSAIDRLASLSWTDGLTQVANRRRFDVALDEEWRRARRLQVPLSLLMVDVDHFKSFNDVYGHRVGDEILRRVAGALTETARRAGDLVARYGGEEFAVLLPSTAAPGVLTVADGVRARVEGLQIPHPTSQRLTVSVGVASCIPASEASPSDLVAAADEALYRAKAQGRNRTALAT